jgi:hypothetical protein
VYSLAIETSSKTPAFPPGDEIVVVGRERRSERAAARLHGLHHGEMERAWPRPSICDPMPFQLEVMNTGPLAADGAYEFLFVLGQPRIAGAVQATVNPVAIR